MRIAADTITRVASDEDVWGALVPLEGRHIVELGCGTAQHTRLLAQAPDVTITAFEVDRVQHARNLAAATPANVEFRYGGAEAISLADASTDVVFMFKSLHHVPVAAMPSALAEIRRILKPGGLAYFSEPIFAGAFNDIIRLFHDEQAVRAAAFEALAAAVASGSFELVTEVFFLAPNVFSDFGEFEARVLNVSHTRHVLEPSVRAEVERRFAACAGPEGARFEAPMRVDVLRKPAA